MAHLGCGACCCCCSSCCCCSCCCFCCSCGPLASPLASTSGSAPTLLPMIEVRSQGSDMGQERGCACCGGRVPLDWGGVALVGARQLLSEASSTISLPAWRVEQGVRAWHCVGAGPCPGGHHSEPHVHSTPGLQCIREVQRFELATQPNKHVGDAQQGNGGARGNQSQPLTFLNQCAAWWVQAHYTLCGA